MGIPKKPSWLSDDDWGWAQSHLPIVCVDVLPVHRLSNSTRVGLIFRDSPMGQVWCHVGGRVNLDEPLSAAAARHLQESLDGASTLSLHPEPFFVNEFFRVERPGQAFDPRKHAVASCYIAEFTDTGEPLRASGHEAEDFRWFPVDELPEADQLWPGTRVMIDRALERLSTNRDPSLDIVTYQTLSDRHLMHNQLMWQTPALAMTAMSFLLTTALSGQQPWMRVVASLLSFVVAIISAQLLAKHSRSELADSKALEHIELRRGMVHVHAAPTYGRQRLSGGLRPWLTGRRSRDWWFRALLSFALASLGIAIVSALSA